MIFPGHLHCEIQTILFFWADKSVQFFYFANWLAHTCKESLLTPKYQNCLRPVSFSLSLSLWLIERKFPQKLIFADLNQHHLRAIVCYNQLKRTHTKKRYLFIQSELNKNNSGTNLFLTFKVNFFPEPLKTKRISCL